jgi:hypothetical protein
MSIALMASAAPRLRVALKCLALVGFVVLFNLVLVANPGYFNHDELQKLDHVERHGLKDYLQQYSRFPETRTFSQPVRPLGFAHQGIVALAMDDAPLVVHLFDVLLHAAVALLSVWIALVARARPAVAWLAGALVAISPLATVSTGWVGASFDRWYSLFALLALGASMWTGRNGIRPFAVLGLAVSSALAIVSKETALMLPAAVLLAAFVSAPEGLPFRARLTRALMAACVAGIPVVAYLLLRLPALMGSLLHGDDVSVYASSLAYVPRNLVAYLAYPFMVTLVELLNFPLHSALSKIVALGLHGVLLGWLVWRGGARAGILYAAGYLVFLAPVMAIQHLGSHYLYFSAVPMSLALAFLLSDAWRDRSWGRLALGIAMVLTLIAHAGYVQAAMYSVGSCQRNVESGMITAIRHAPGREFEIQALPGAPGYVARRTLFGRPDFRAMGPVTITVTDPGSAPVDGPAFRLTMGSDCLLVPANE